MAAKAATSSHRHAARGADDLPLTDSPSITINGQTVTAYDITPGGQVVFFGVALEPTGYESMLVRWSQTVTDTGDTGTVQFDAGRDISCKSVWVVVDIATGAYAVAAPPDCPLRFTALPALPFKRGAGGSVNNVIPDARNVEMLYVEPGTGAWTSTAMDGYESDADGAADGSATVALSSATPLQTGATAPTAFASGNVLIVVDSINLDVVAVVLDDQMLSGVRP